MVMSAKTEFWIAVIGLSGRENGESFQGPGKSCLCDRFMTPDEPPSIGHTSIISQQDFHGPIVNTDHFLYWGRTRKTVDGKVIEFNIIEQTEFLDDVTFNPFNARDPYIKRATATSINSSRKIQYLTPEQLQDPKSQKAQKFTSRKLHIDGFLCVYDVSKVNDRHAGTQYKFVFELLDLIDVPVVLVATKCDKGRSRHFDEMMYLAKVQKVPIVETSAIEDVNVAQAFFSLVRIFNRQVIISKKHIQYFNPREIARSRKNKKERKAEKKLNMKKAREARNGDDGEMSIEWTEAPPAPDTPPNLPPSRHSPLTDSLLSDPPCECPYEHINGDDDMPGDDVNLGDGLKMALYENCTNFDSQDDSSRGVSSHESSVQGFSRSSSGGSRSVRPRDIDFRDSQSKSDSLQSKTSSEEYIPVPRAAYDPSENYENVRYNHATALKSSSALNNPATCPSPTSHSSDSEKGSFLTGVPDHMKSLESQRPWENCYYTNVITVEPPQQSDRTSSDARSTSSIDTDCQANINYGRQLSGKCARNSHHSSGSGNNNVQSDITTDQPAYENVIKSELQSFPDDCTLTSYKHREEGEPFRRENEKHGVPTSEAIETDGVFIPSREVRNGTTLYDLMEDSTMLSPKISIEGASVRREEGVVSSSEDEDNDLPPYPEICFTSNEGLTTSISTELDEMNTLVGEISSLVWQNEPLPPPPSDFLTPSTIPDFEKTPTISVSDKSEFDDNDYDHQKVCESLQAGDSDLYENIRLPEIPPRRPALPPRTDISNSLSSRDGSSTHDVISSYDVMSDDSSVHEPDIPAKPDLPERIPLSNLDMLDTFLASKDQKISSRMASPLRDVTLPSANLTLLSRDVTTSPHGPTLLAHDLAPSPRDISPRDISPRDNSLRDISPRDISPRDVSPRDILLRDGCISPRDILTVAREIPLTIPLPPREPAAQPQIPSNVPRRDEDPPALKFAPRIPAMHPPHRMIAFPLRQPVTTETRNSTSLPPNVPPRIKADTSMSANNRQPLSSPHMPARVPFLPPPMMAGKNPVYTEVDRLGTAPPRVIHRHEFSPYVVPNAPRIDRWEEYTGSCIEKKSQNVKKKVKVKIPQR